MTKEMTVNESGFIQGYKVENYVQAVTSSGDLTNGKTYPVVSQDGNRIRVVDDKGDVYAYDKDNFKASTYDKYLASIKYVRVNEYGKKQAIANIDEDKKYLVIKEDSVDYYILDDEGDARWYAKGFFDIVVSTELSGKEEPLSYEELVKESFNLLREVKYKNLATIVETKNTKAIYALVNEINTIENYIQ